MDSAQGTSQKKSYDWYHKVSDESKTKFKKGHKQTKTTMSQMARNDFKKINQYDVKRSLGSIVDVVNPLASVSGASVEISEIYKKLDDLKAQEKKSDFQKLVIDSVKDFGFIHPYAKPEYEYDFDYAMPFYFLTGLQGIQKRSHQISELLSKPDDYLSQVRGCMKASGNIVPFLKAGAVAAQSLFLLNHLCMNEDSVEVYLPHSKDLFFCRIFKKEQYSDLKKSLNLLSQFAYKLSKGSTKAASEMLPSISHCIHMLALYDKEVTVQRSHFLTLTKEAILSLNDPFSMSSLNDALPTLTDESVLQLSSVASAMSIS